MALATLLGTFRVTMEPEAKEVGPNNARVLEIRGAANKNKRVDPGTGDNGSDFKNVATHFVNLVAWREMAEAIFSEGLHVGDQIEITGSPETQRWEKDGQKHSKDVVTIRTYKIWKKDQNNGGGGFGRQQQSVAGAAAGQGFGGQQQQQQSNNDPWGPASGSGGFGGNYDDEPPF